METTSVNFELEKFKTKNRNLHMSTKWIVETLNMQIPGPRGCTFEICNAILYTGIERHHYQLQSGGSNGYHLLYNAIKLTLKSKV